MIVVQGRHCYSWRGWLFRAKDGVLEASAQTKPDFRPFDPDDPPDACPEPDEELRARLPDLLAFWDHDV